VTAADRTHEARTQVRVTVAGTGAVNVATGVSVLDHLLGLLARYASFDLALEVAPGDPEEEVRAAGRAFGEALAEPLRVVGRRGHGSAVVPSAEALAHVTLEASDEPLLVSNVDLSGARLGGMATDVVASFLHEFVDGASPTLHVRLVDGSDTQHVVEDDLGGHIAKIEDGPWPSFPADLTSIAVTVATQADGTMLMFEKMFENRLFFTDKLVSMGARIILCDPHRAVVTGPSKLRGQRMESPDIRAGMAMLLASLCAEGPSKIGAVYQIDKGYERIDERLRALGAQIERIES